MNDTDTADAHKPRPRETPLDNGDLVVSSHWVWGTRDATTVTADDQPLYRLLMELLEECHVPDLMPARLASECDDLVEVREAVEDLDRGSAIIDGAGYGMSYCFTVRDAIEEYRDREPLRLVAVGCSGSKHNVAGAVPAADLYKGAYWTCKERYAEEIGDEWRIVSAKHALVEPDEEIETYERTPSDLEYIPVDSDERLPNGDDVDTLLDHWALEVSNGLVEWLDRAIGGIDPRDTELEILLGRSYREPLEDRGVFDVFRTPADLSISFPFQEVEEAAGGIGKQMGWMNSVVEATAVEAEADADGAAAAETEVCH